MELITNNALVVIAILLVVLAGSIIYYSLQFGVAKEKDKQIARQVQQLKNEKIDLNNNLVKAHNDYNQLKTESKIKYNEYQSTIEDLNECVSTSQAKEKEFDSYKSDANEIEAALKEFITSLEEDSSVYENALNAVSDILDETLVAFDGTKVYKAFEYGGTKKGEVIAKKDKKSIRKPVKIGYMFDNEFCALEDLVGRLTVPSEDSVNSAVES